MRRHPVVAVLAVAGALVGPLLLPAPAGAAGVTTHGWMAVEAIELVGDDELASLLLDRAELVRTSAMFPDLGYVGTNTFGEEAHWQRFVDALVEGIRGDGCDTRAELLDDSGPCPDLVAQVLGVAAHGMGDEVWDWLFEPNGPDLDEYYTEGPALFTEGGAEGQMDVVAIGLHGVPRPIVPTITRPDLLVAAFEAAGLSGVTEEQFALVALAPAVWDLEQSLVPEHLPAIVAAMPWMSANLVTGPGGVDFAARAIAGYWSSIWARLQGADPTTEVSITYPAPGQTDVPSTGWVRGYQAGSSRSGGGARTRITAVLTDSMPYRAPGGPGVSNQLPAGTLTITDESTGAAVPVLAGYPRVVPYTADPGEHLVDVQPAVDLRACTWHRVDVGVAAPLVDARGEAVTPHSWSFRTECAAGQVVGRATDPGGAPVAGAWVLPYLPGDGWFPSTTFAVTGADGRYDLGQLPPGSYRVAVVPPAGLGLSTTWSGGQPSRAGAIPFVVDAGATSELTHDVELAGAGRVAGSVSIGGVPVAGATVRAFGPADVWVATAVATTAADGTFELAGLPVATYQLAVRAPSGGGFWWYAGSRSRAAATPVDLATGPQVDLVMRLP